MLLKEILEKITFEDDNQETGEVSLLFDTDEKEVEIEVYEDDMTSYLTLPKSYAIKAYGEWNVDRVVLINFEDRASVLRFVLSNEEGIYE